MKKIIALAAIFIALICISLILKHNYYVQQELRQKTTLANMYAISNCFQYYFVDHKEYPIVNSAADLSIGLCPDYWKMLSPPKEKFPIQDAWGHDFNFEVWKSDPSSPGPDSFAIGSSGKDGIWERADLKSYPNSTLTYSLNNDIVLVNGVFMQHPEGSAER